MSETRELPPGAAYRHPAEADLDTPEEQAQALLRDLRESFAPSYLTLISIIEGVLLGLGFELIATGHIAVRLQDPAILLVFNNLVLIMLVWNEYRMGSSMFHWVPALPDAVIPFMLGGFQAALLLTVPRPLSWLGWLAAFYAAAIIAYQNMYCRAGEEERNAFVMERNRGFRRLNLASCLLSSALLWAVFSYHSTHDSIPGWSSLGLVTLVNVSFLLRGEANWRAIVAAARSGASSPGRAPSERRVSSPVTRIAPARGPFPLEALSSRGEPRLRIEQQGVDRAGPYPLSIS
jgi:hypothetical protein